MQTWSYTKPLATATAVAVVAILLTSAMLWGLALSADTPAAPRFVISIFALG